MRSDDEFLGAFAKLLKATVSFVMSVCPPDRMEQLGSYWTDVLEVLCFENFSKICLENSSFVNI
jgi:hypothetical protein